LRTFQLEHLLTKDQILEIYMNQIFLGNRAYGFAAASEAYFGKPLKDISIAEAAMLAGLPKAPSAYNPIINPSTILGYGDWHSSSCAIFRQVYEGFNWYTPGINGFVDVEDVAIITLMLMESTVSEERFIVNGDSWPFKKLQDTIADGFGKKHPARQTTPFLLALAWRLEKLKSFFTGKKPLLTKESARVAQSQTWFENTKVLKALPEFSFTPLEESIKKACEKYLAATRPVQP